MEFGPGNGNGILIQQSSLSLPDRTVPYMALSVRLAELLACTYTGAGQAAGHTELEQHPAGLEQDPVELEQDPAELE